MVRTLRRGTLPAVLLLAAAALPLAARDDKPKGQRYALLVGVKAYDHSKLDPLKYTENDVEDLARLLGAKSGGFAEVILLTTTRGDTAAAAQPTGKNIRTALKDLLRRCKRDDTVLVALAGHGLQLKVQDGKEEKDEAFFCPRDAQWKDVSTLISLKWLIEQLDDSGAGVKLVLVDACRNDPKQPRSMDVDTVPRPPRGTAVLYSCASGQRAWEKDKLGGKGHGVFFHFVLEGLKGKAANDDGEVTWSRLTDYVAKRVSREVPMLIGGGAQQSPHNLTNIVGASPVLIGKVDPGQTVLEPVKEITNTIGMTLKLIPAGKFTMGSPPGERDRLVDEDAHEVRITKAFYMGACTVTVGQFRRFVRDEAYRTEAEDGDGGFGYNGAMKRCEGPRPAYSWKHTGWSQSDKHPVVNVSWNDAMAFCEWLNRTDKKKEKGWAYRLPTEAEWEYACRAGTRTRYHFGDDARDLKQYANVADRSLRRLVKGKEYAGWVFGTWDDTYPFTAPVGSFRPNAWGLCDMHGNVYQWCADWYGKDYYKSKEIEDPKGPLSGGHRVVRGGTWHGSMKGGPPTLRCALRGAYQPGKCDYDIGFRVVLAPVAAAP